MGRQLGDDDTGPQDPDNRIFVLIVVLVAFAVVVYVVTHNQDSDCAALHNDIITSQQAVREHQPGATARLSNEIERARQIGCP